MEATVSAKSVVHAITEEICRAVSSEVSRFLGTSCSIGSVRCTPVLSLNGFPIEEKNELKNIIYQLKMSGESSIGVRSIGFSIFPPPIRNE